MSTVLMILLKIVLVIPQKSYVCDSYITDKKSLYAGGGCIYILPLDSPLARGKYLTSHVTPRVEYLIPASVVV